MKLLATAVLCCSAVTAQAGEVYVQGGFPGAMVGAGQNLSDRFVLRAEVGTAGRRTYVTTEEGINYDARLRTGRAAVFGDWFVSEGGNFRLTGGVTFNDYRLVLGANGGNGSITIGNTTYVTTPNDRIEARIKVAPVTPYFGIGWGHRGGGGWRFLADVGATFGRGKVSLAVSGPFANQVSQSDLDREAAELRDSIAFVRWIPQVTFGASYSF